MTPHDPAVAVSSRRAALAYLTRGSIVSEAVLADDGRRVVRWAVPWGLLVGLAWMAAFRAAWRLYGDPEVTRVRLLPALAVVLVECLMTGMPLMLGFGRACDRLARARHAEPSAGVSVGNLALVLVVLVHWVLLASLPERTGWYPPPDTWRASLNVLFPLATYRPIVLAPVWGRWGMLLAGSVGRAAADADAATRAVCAAIGPGRALRWLAVPVLLTAAYLSPEGQLFNGLCAGVIALACTYAFALACARRLGGQSRDTIFAGAAVAQLAFLAAYRALCLPEWG